MVGRLTKNACVTFSSAFAFEVAASASQGRARRPRGTELDVDEIACARRALLRGVSFARHFAGRRTGVRRAPTSSSRMWDCPARDALPLGARLVVLRARLPTLRSSSRIGDGS